MRPRARKRGLQTERYELQRSPFSQRPTQRDLAALLGETRDDLRRLVNYKETFIVRRQIVTGKSGKVRDLAYPEGRLRALHERLKFHLNKIKQPNYLFSPRRNRGQRQNAALHLEQDQYLTLDLKQFYPSTTDHMVRRCFVDDFGMHKDVAGLLTHLCIVDGAVSMGSPATPLLCTLIHRRMFDRIAAICDARGLRYSVWVDDLTISGRFIPREVLASIRQIVREAGLKSHRIAYRTGNRPVFVTGIGVVGPMLVAPLSLHRKIKEYWAEYHSGITNDERDFVCQRLLSHLGTLRHIAGAESAAGRKAADQMNSLRQERDNRHRAARIKSNAERAKRNEAGPDDAVSVPF